MPSVMQRIHRASTAASHLLIRFAKADGGQDLIEYAYLAAFIGVTSWIAINGITDAVAAAYTSWIDPTIGVPSAWDPPEPPFAGS